MFDAEFTRKVGRPAWKSTDIDDNLVSSEEKPFEERGCREKGGKLQMEDHDSKKEKLRCSTWDLRGRNSQSWVEERGRKRCYQELSCSNGRNWSTVNKLGKIFLKSSSFEGDLHQVDPLEDPEINYKFSIWPYLVV